MKGSGYAAGYLSFHSAKHITHLTFWLFHRSRTYQRKFLRLTSQIQATTEKFIVLRHKLHEQWRDQRCAECDIT
jgi:hypothetical protein